MPRVTYDRSPIGLRRLPRGGSDGLRPPVGTSKGDSIRTTARTAFTLAFPFWLVHPRSGKACQGEGQVAVFSSAAKAVAFMEAQADGDWNVRLASRTSKTDTAVFFAQAGCTAVCFDQEPDGSGGELVPVAELLRVWTL